MKQDWLLHCCHINETLSLIVTTQIWHMNYEIQNKTYYATPFALLLDLYNGDLRS